MALDEQADRSGHAPALIYETPEQQQRVTQQQQQPQPDDEKDESDARGLALSLKESNSGRNSLVDVRQQKGPATTRIAQQGEDHLRLIKTQTDDAA